MTLMETWVEEKNWGRIRDRLPGGYSWGRQDAEKVGRRGYDNGY